MILNTVKPTIETSEVFKENFFSISDYGMIFDILRNKLYSNPILSICREISCNAVDAHREVGKQDTPIQITLPTTFDPYYKIKDWGPGISPDRMENIFVKFGSSTKRNTNSQIGSFGLGAKCPMAYTDTFTIETVVDGIKYNYACVIDETQIGKIVLLSKIPTDDPNGTEIIIEVKSSDSKTFIDDTKQVCRHWKTKPIIKNGPITWEEMKTSLSGDNWKIVADSAYTYRGEAKLIIDEIEYPLDLHQLKNFKNHKFFGSISGALLLNFKTGDLSLSANREAVHLDAPTQTKIVAALNLAIGEIKSTIEHQVSQCSTYYQACYYWTTTVRSQFHSTDFLHPILWNGIELLYNGIRTDYYNDQAVFISFERSKTTTSKRATTYRSTQYNFYFQENGILYFNDLGVKNTEITALLVKPIFDANPTAERIYVIASSGYGGTEKPNFDKLDKKFHLTELGVKNLSSITSAPPAPKPKGSGKRLLVFKFGPSKFYQVPLAELEKDTEEKVLCILRTDVYSSRRYVFHKNAISDITLAQLKAFSPKTSFYGVDEAISASRIKNDLPKMMSLEEFAEKAFAKTKNLDMALIQYACSREYYNRCSAAELNSFKEKQKLFINSNSSYVQYLLAEEKIFQVEKEHRDTWEVYRTFIGAFTVEEMNIWKKKHPEYDDTALYNKMLKTYPLLEQLEYNHRDEITPAVIQYINLIDAEGTKKCKQK